ncbi:MAG: hypothetical protein QW076_05480 [Candidatus Anstonellales archaeon]
MLINEFKLAPYIIYTESKFGMLDPVFQFLLQLTKMQLVALVLIFIGIIYAYKVQSSLRFLAILGLSGLIGAIGGKFIHFITDYTLRLNVFIMLAAPMGLYYGAQLIQNIFRKIILKKMQSSRILLIFIFSVILIGSVSSWFFSQLMYPETPKTASDSHFYIHDAFLTSTFIGNNLESPNNILFLGNYRYRYLTSIYKIDLNEDYGNLWSIYVIRRQSIFLVLSKLSVQIDDRYSPPLGKKYWDQLYGNAVILFDSRMSKVFLLKIYNQKMYFNTTV